MSHYNLPADYDLNELPAKLDGAAKDEKIPYPCTEPARNDC